MKLNSIFVAAALACGVLARPFSDIKYYTRDLDFGEVGARELYDINYPREVYEELYARKSVSLRSIVCSMCVAHALLPRRKKRRPRRPGNRPRKNPESKGKRRKDRQRPHPRMNLPTGANSFSREFYPECHIQTTALYIFDT